ncbi:MAG TPA: hypothetical protein PK625_08725, partial [Spirochaetales bacterium]|nr:hypothetical protein [Spirochaetales bacterium]
GHIMGVSERSKDGVRGVAERMGSSSESVAAMHQKSRELSDSMDRVAESFALVEEAIRGIREIGERSVSGLDALERELARLDAD